MTQARQKSTTTHRSGAAFVPDFCRIALVFVVVVSAELLSIVLVLGAADSLADFWRDLSLMSLYVQWIALVSAGLLCAMGKWLNRQSNGLAALSVWLLIMLVTLAVSEAAFRLAEQLGPSFTGIDERADFMLRSLGVAALVGLLLIHYFQLHHRWQQQLVAESEARLQALQSRIRPHFLFNSMNTIASLTRSDPEMAEEITQDLADLFRVSLSDARQNSTLGRELELARQYLNIEQQRLGERLQVEWDLRDLPEQAVLPPLMLQPLLENGIYHGIEPSLEPGIVRIIGRFSRGLVNLSIRNSLPDEVGEKHRKGNRMAMDNIRQRLSTMFGDKATLAESSVDGEYQVRLVFPHPRPAA